MGDFNRDRNSDRRDSRPSDRNGSDRPQLHNAICDNCSKRCKVPFEPTQGKPIYCSDCYEKLGNQNSRRNEGGRDDNRGGFNRRDDNRRDFRDRDDNGMHPAICDDCGKDCQVPFRPTGEKPIYCSQCFEDRGNGRDMEPRERPMVDHRPPKDPAIDEINTKLNALKDSINTRLNLLEGINTRLTNLEGLEAKMDRILSLLEPKSEPVKEKKAVTKKVSVKKTSTKGIV